MLPTGTVTFLFTDIEGSTRLWEEQPELMPAALVRHNELLQAAVTGQSGHIIKNKGDGVIAVFAGAPDALAAALAAQRALQSEAWDERLGEIRVRMALHTGAAEEREGDYFGPHLNRTARLEATAHGRQVVLSGVTQALVQDELPEGASLIDLGRHHLKSLSRPEQIFQLQAAGLVSEFPPLQTQDAARGNLPAPATSFVGRAQELAEIGRIIGEPGCRLLTLLGPGGIGKTRLALQTARRQAPAYRHGAYFVPLAPLSAPEHMVASVGESLNFTFDTHSSDLDPKTQLIDYLSGRDAFIVLDNFEHLLAGAELLAELLTQAPQIKLMVTSREKLNLQGEWTYDVRGMRFPRNGNGAAVEDYSALQLFLERARQAQPRFDLSPAERPFANRICRLVAGTPLGIELAAAWVSMLSCQEIATEIERNLDFLASSRRDLPEKHRSLRAAFDYSWQSLNERQQDSFRKLSVFRGSFDRQAAMEVAGANLLVLADLVNKSLLRRTRAGRYEVHELLRQFAAENLDARPEEKAQVLAAHSAYFVAFLAAREKELLGENLIEFRDEVRAEMENVRAAGRWAAVHWETERALGALHSLFIYYEAQGMYEGSEALKSLAELVASERVARGDSESDPVYLDARIRAAYLDSILGRTEEAEAIAQHHLPQLRQAGLKPQLAWCLFALGNNAIYRGENGPAEELLEEALVLGREAADGNLVALILLWLGWVVYLDGEFDEAHAMFSESNALFSENGNRWGQAFALSKLGLVADARKDFALARQYHEEARDIFAAFGDPAGQAYTESRLSMVAYGMENYEEAYRFGRRGLALFEETGHRWGICASLCRIGFAAVGLGDWQEAERCFDKALALTMAQGMTPTALYALAGIAALRARQGETDAAVALFTFVRLHPQTPGVYLEMAQRWLAAPLAELTPAALAAVEAAAGARQLEEVVTGLQADRTETAGAVARVVTGD